MSLINSTLPHFHFSQISLLITHYNRSSSLKRLLISFEKLNCSFGEIVVADDGSKTEHIEVIGKLSEHVKFRLITAERNSGLGNNINKGQDAVMKPYTLYVQEDFIPTVDFPECLKSALEMVTENDELDVVRFYAYFLYPYLRDYKKGFAEMYLPFLGLRYSKIHQYSDHPHLRRSSFLSKFGRYQEGIEGDKTEYNMCVSFIRNKGKALFYKDYRKLFIQVNLQDEPSTMVRGKLRRSDNPFIVLIRDVYRQIKNNYNIHILKTRS